MMDYHLLNDHLYRQISGKDFQSKAEMTQKKEVASVVKEHTPFVATCKLIRAFSKPKLSYIDFVSVYIQVVVLDDYYDNAKAFFRNNAAPKYIKKERDNIRRTIHVSLFDLETESIKSVIDCFYSVYLHRKGKNNEVEVVESILRECGGVSVLPYHFEKWSIESHIVKVSDIQFVGAKCNNELKDMHQLLFKDAENRK